MFVCTWNTNHAFFYISRSPIVLLSSIFSSFVRGSEFYLRGVRGRVLYITITTLRWSYKRKWSRRCFYHTKTTAFKDSYAFACECYSYRRHFRQLLTLQLQIFYWKFCFEVNYALELRFDEAGFFYWNFLKCEVLDIIIKPLWK